MDNFGFDTQGSKYQQFRPTYKQTLYMKTIQKLKNKNRYLDIAMGTGQLLFRIAPFFKHNHGIDISNKMLEAAREKLKSLPQELQKTITIQNKNVIDIDTNTGQQIDQQKYDLITIGQAFHWFPIKDTLNKLRNHLTPDGKLLIISYITRGVQDQKEDQRYQQFYDQVKPYFDFDRTELQDLYRDKEKYPFEQYYPKVERNYLQVTTQMTKATYVNYLKTYSGYNQYLVKNKDKEDPILSLEKECADKVRVVIDFFSVECAL